jgi:hypothetical protein
MCSKWTQITHVSLSIAALFTDDWMVWPRTSAAFWLSSHHDPALARWFCAHRLRNSRMAGGASSRPPCDDAARPAFFSRLIQHPQQLISVTREVFSAQTRLAWARAGLFHSNAGQGRSGSTLPCGHRCAAPARILQQGWAAPAADPKRPASIATHPRPDACLRG